jgi:hypothetical protein
MIEEFFSIIMQKSEEGIEKLRELEIGTEEFTALVTQLISNFNLLSNKEQLMNPARRAEMAGLEQGQGQAPDVRRHIGKEFN